MQDSMQNERLVALLQALHNNANQRGLLPTGPTAQFPPSQPLQPGQLLPSPSPEQQQMLQETQRKYLQPGQSPFGVDTQGAPQ